MSRELYISDARYKLSSKDMIKNIETIDNKTIYYYNENYIEGKTIQYEIFDGIWIVYDDVVIKTSEQLFPVEETGLIEMNYCISGRCEFNFLNHKVFYMGTGDFVAALSNNECHKHNFPLGNYKGMSITTSPKNLDGFLKTIFPDTVITSNLLVNKMRQYGKYKYIILLNNSIVQNIIKEIILTDNIFWKEKAILKFAELVLLLINDDVEVGKAREKYFDRHLVDKVKMIKNEVTKNTEVYVKIKQISEKYDINSRIFSECFKEIYGKTYYAFIKEFRIKKAADMLKNTDKTIGNIAITVGYQNASKFSKAFLDVMGVTPIHFRKNN
jgi:AraC-like DNA-binding protein